MTIDGINISTFGLALSYLGDHLNQPARKIILQEPEFETKDIVFDSKEPVITLVGIFPTKEDLLTGIEGLKNLIKSELIHAFNISEHGLNFNGVVADGMIMTVVQTMAKVYFKVTIVE